MPQLGEKRKAKELGYNHRQSYIWAACARCGIERWVTMRYGKAKHPHCQRCKHIGNKFRWNGGIHLKSGGYWQVRVYPDNPYYIMANHMGYVLQHRLIMAEYLMRPLKQYETVHHKNGDKNNNNIANLQLRVGVHGKGVALICGDCGSKNIKEDKL